MRFPPLSPSTVLVATSLAVPSALVLGCSSDDTAHGSPDGGHGANGGATSSGGSKTTGGASSNTGSVTATGGAQQGGAGSTSSGGTSPTDAGSDGNDSDGGDGLPAGGIFDMIGSPWGLAPSASSSRGFASWMPEMAAGGVTWVRGFDGAQTDATLTTATANGLQLSGILVYSKSSPQTFPVDDLPGFTTYVKNTITKTKGKINYWEVWNEPPNFSENKSPADYATTVKTAYDAAKAADPAVNVGIAVQSVNLNFLADALDAGAADHFDYVTVHPYETMGLVASGWEPEYLSIVPAIRKLLADKSPSRANVPVIITEVGEPIGGDVTRDHQADTLVKAYILSLAQGVARIHWFEPLDGDSGPFGLVDNDGTKRPSYIALQTLIERLGTVPSYQGYLALDSAGDYYGFVFRNEATNLLVAWARPGKSLDLQFGGSAQVIDPKTGKATPATRVSLNNAPVVVSGVPASFVKDARANAARPYPWGGDYSAAKAVSWSAASGDKGLHPLGDGKNVTLDGKVARDISAGPGIGFTVDPNFNSYTKATLKVTAVLRRNGADNAGFNLKYESVTGYHGTGGWFTVPEGTDWTTKSWTIDDPQFVGKWGYNLTLDSDSTQNSNYALESVTVEKQ